ncbi:hypothetical protein [Novacetimonas hansenii]|uniref:hypothetical protein n=1 Tax=Novacetimonas hansenii TaxID=436 RepID=UPI0009502E6E|nr:hypothetical protein [Novacetimonas hansenii]
MKFDPAAAAAPAGNGLWKPYRRCDIMTDTLKIALIWGLFLLVAVPVSAISWVLVWWYGVSEWA